MAAVVWLRGIIKEIPSGDTLVVTGVVKPGTMPPEKRITLSSLIAPKLGRRDGSTADEPFAWESREFLRNKCVGQTCVFKVDYTLENIPGREFGSVFVGDHKENIALSSVQSGWAKIRQSGGQQSPFITELVKAEEEAKTAELGIWTKDPKALANAVRPLQDSSADATSLLAKHGKGKPIPGIVEQVLNGSTMRLTVLPDFTSILVYVCGIQCPSMGRRPPASATAEGAPPPEEAEPEPFAREAKYTTETKCLNREVRVVLEGVDKYGNLFGSVKYPEAAEPVDLAQTLVKEGLAKVVEWGLNMMTNGAFKLRELEREAKQKKLNIWKNYVAPASAGTEKSDKFAGTIVEVVTGDCLMVRDPSGKEHRLNLSSIRVPRMGRRDSRNESEEEKREKAWGYQAKEFLRQRYVGKPVDVNIEYTRKVQPMPGSDLPPNAPDMTFATILYKDKDGVVVNLAEQLLSAGLANTVKHRTDDQRSAHYVELMQAEETAQKARKGLHNKSAAVPMPRINDISVQGSANRAKQMLPFLQRNGRMNAVCEFVMSGHRLRLFIPKESTTIAFSPSGVRTPQRSGGAGYGGGAVKEEPFGDAAYQHTRDSVLQRDVEIEVETVDKAGTFLGTLRIPGPKPINLGIDLLEKGLAKLHPSFNPERTKDGNSLMAAEAKAKAARLNVWQNAVDEPETNGTSASNGDAPTLATERKKMEIVVTEVADGNTFYAQQAEEPRVSWLTEQIATLAMADKPGGPPTLREGSMCLAQYTVDNQWYRAIVDKVVKGETEKEYEVVFLDYGNQERVPSSATKPIEPQLEAVPSQAMPCALAFLKVPGLDDNYGVDAANLLCDKLGGGKRMVAYLEHTEPLAGKPKHIRQPKSKWAVSLFLPDSTVSLNEEVVAEGLARVAVPRGPKSAAVTELLEKLKAAEQKAKRSHAGVWRYGDPGDDEEEEDRPVRGRGGRR